MDSIPKNITYIKTIVDLEKIATYSKISDEVCRYELFTANCDPSHVEDNSKSYGDNAYFYIPLRHLFQGKYETAIVSFLDKRQDVCIQITLLQALTVFDNTNVCEWKDNYTYCKSLSDQNTTRFIAKIGHHNNIQEFIIGFAPTHQKPVLLTVTDERPRFNLSECIKHYYKFLSVISLLLFLYQYIL